MTIAHVGMPHLPILYKMGGAIERRIRELASRQAEAGSRVLVYSPEERSGRQNYYGAEIRAIACKRSGLLKAAEFLTKSLRDVRKEKPDVIHFHSMAEGAELTKLFARGCVGKTVLSFDYFKFRRGKETPLFGWYKRALGSFHSLLPVSDYCLRESASYWNIPAQRMRVLYNGVSLQQFHPDPQDAEARRQSLNVAHDEFLMVYVGRVCLQKGTDLLVEAYSRMRARGAKVRLVIAGPIGQFGHEGSHEITSKLLAVGGAYLGPVEESILPSIYNVADVFVLPTRVDEMFGMAAIEAQACGKPVVCSNNGGLPEVVNMKSGSLFESGDVDGLYHCLSELEADLSLRKRLSEAALSNARRFSWESIVADLQTVYES